MCIHPCCEYVCIGDMYSCVCYTYVHVFVCFIHMHASVCICVLCVIHMCMRVIHVYLYVLVHVYIIHVCMCINRNACVTKCIFVPRLMSSILGIGHCMARMHHECACVDLHT